MHNTPENETRRVRLKMVLFVAGDEPNSRKALENLTRVCRERLDSDYELEVIDVLEDFQSALSENILVTPALVVTEPPPRVIVIGNLTDTAKLLTALRLT